MPMFFFGGVKDWFEGKFGHSIEEGLKEKRLEVCDALDSFLIGSPSDRKLFESAIEKIEDPGARKVFTDEWHESHRTSMRDFCGYAWKLSAKIRASTPDPAAESSVESAA